MRVTHVITRLIIGGAQENTVATVLGLQGKPGLQVDLISGPATGPEGSLASALPPPVLTVMPELVRPIHPYYDLAALLRLTRHFRLTHPQIVHTHSGKAGILGRIAARRAGVPIIVHTIHGPSFGPFQGWAANALFTAAERYAGRATTHFVTVANAMSRQYLQAGIGRAIRTAIELPPRMILIDRMVAFLPVQGIPGAAIMIRQESMVHFLRAVFDLIWSTAAAVQPGAALHLPDALDKTSIRIVQLLADGYTDKAIGAKLGMSERTVREYVRKIYDLLKVKSRFQAGAAAASRGLINIWRGPWPAM